MFAKFYKTFVYILYHFAYILRNLYKNIYKIIKNLKNLYSTKLK